MPRRPTNVLAAAIATALCFAAFVELGFYAAVDENIGAGFLSFVFMALTFGTAIWCIVAVVIRRRREVGPRGFDVLINDKRERSRRNELRRLPMLDGLDAIDWASLTHAYGSAADVPDLLRALTSPDDGERERAAYELYGNIWHQGTVYPATAAAVPFLYELLADAPAPRKSEIAGLLASIAAGCGYLEVHAVDDYGEETWRQILSEKGKSLERELEHEAAETRAVRQAAATRLLDLVPHLCDPEPEHRRAVAAALGHYPEHAAATLPELQKAVQGESDEEVLEALTESIRRLKQ